MKKYLKTTVVLAIMFVMADVAFGSVYSYGGSESITLTTAEWTVISPPTKLSDFNYTSTDITSILAYNASTGEFVDAASSELLKEPTNAFYMLPNTNKGTAVSFVWDAYTPGSSSKELSAGWNLIGTNVIGEVINELNTIQPYVSTINVPRTLNARKSSSGSSWGSGNDNHDIAEVNWISDFLLNPRDGYWAYMTSPITYTKVLN